MIPAKQATKSHYNAPPVYSIIIMAKEYGALLLPPQRFGRQRKEYRCLQAVWEADKNHPQAETEKVLLRRLPHRMVEITPGVHQPKSNL